MCHAALVQTDNVVPLIRPLQPRRMLIDLDAAVHGGTDNGTNGCSCRGVAAAREHADALYCIFLGFTMITTELLLTRHEIIDLFYRIFQKPQ